MIKNITVLRFSIIMSCLFLLNAGAGTLDEAAVKKKLRTISDKKEMPSIRYAALKLLVEEKEKTVVPVIGELVLDTSADQKLRILAMQSFPEFYPEFADECISIADKYFIANLLPFQGDRAGAKWISFNPKELPFIIEFMHTLAKTGKREAISSFILPIRTKETHYLCPLVLSEMGKPAVAFLLSMLDDEDPKTRKNCVISLGKIGDTRAVAALIEMLKEDKNVGVRLEVARSLVLIGDKKAVPFLETAQKKAKLAEEANELENAVKKLKGKK